MLIYEEKIYSLVEFLFLFCLVLFCWRMGKEGGNPIRMKGLTLSPAKREWSSGRGGSPEKWTEDRFMWPLYWWTYLREVKGGRASEDDFRVSCWGSRGSQSSPEMEETEADIGGEKTAQKLNASSPWWTVNISTSIRRNSKTNHLSIVLYDSNANIGNIAVMKICLNGNQEFIFFRSCKPPPIIMPVNYFTNIL